MPDAERNQLALSIPAATRGQMERIKAERKWNFTDQVIQAIDRLHADLFPVADASAVVIGYLRLDRPGEIEADELTCTECGQNLGFARGAFLAVARDQNGLSLAGPLCAVCAHNE